MGTVSRFHLAQVNIARALAPPDNPLMAGFNAQIEHVNAVADAAPGFVWRWKSDEWRTGLCRTEPELLPDGRLRLHEEWQWTNGDCSRGSSVVEEVA